MEERKPGRPRLELHRGQEYQESGARTREQALIDARPATHRPGERPRLSGPTGSPLGDLMGQVATNIVTGRPLP